MDILDLAMKGIIAITRNYGKKVCKNGPAPEIKDVEKSTISGDGYRIGFSRDEIMPDLNKDTTYWIAGHGSGHKMEGILSPVYVSAVWIDCGNEEGMLWLGGDVIGMTRIEINKIRSMILESKVIKGCKLINFSATHSHSGIDTLGYWGKPNAVNIPSDGKDWDYMNMLFAKCVKVAEEAYLNRKSGKLYMGSVNLADSLFTRRGFIDKHEVLSRLRFVPADGSSETWIMNFGGHANSLGGSNRMLSGEYPYFMREQIKEECGADVLFGIGPIGAMDVADYDENDKVNCIKLQAKMLADGVKTISNDEELKPEISYIQQPFYLPVGNYVLTLLALRHTMSFKAYACPESDTNIAMETEMTYMSIGGKKILLLPGENFVSTVYGSYMPADVAPTGKGPEINPTPLAEIAGDKSIVVFGVSNDMTGYVVPPNDFILNPTQPYLNGVKDKNGLNHYHETNSMGLGTQKTIADTFAKVANRLG